jgi:5-(aminomethyl)-3-furanmethanol phosphate kinase
MKKPTRKPRVRKPSAKPRPLIIKIGGSLLHLKALESELQTLLDGLEQHQVVLLTGGGPAVKALRKLNTLSEEAAHWQCIKLMGDLTRTLSETFPNSVAVTSWAEVESAWQADRYPWFVVEPFLRADDKQKDHLPHTWEVSSDSIAAHLAHRFGGELVLVKACALPKREMTPTSLVKQEIVDAHFPQMAKKLKHWKLINLPGGTLPEIALDLFESERVAARQHKRPRARR